jgi:hypothetical protein
LLIQFADLLQDVLQAIEVLQVPSDLRDLFFGQTEVADRAFGIADGQHPHGVPLAVIAFSAASAMSNRALE